MASPGTAKTDYTGKSNKKTRLIGLISQFFDIFLNFS